MKKLNKSRSNRRRKKTQPKWSNALEKEKWGIQKSYNTNSNNNISKSIKTDELRRLQFMLKQQQQQQHIKYIQLHIAKYCSIRVKMKKQNQQQKPTLKKWGKTWQRAGVYPRIYKTKLECKRGDQIKTHTLTPKPQSKNKMCVC